MDAAQEKVNLPGIALMAIGGISALLSLLGLLWQIFTAVTTIGMTGGDIDWIAFLFGQGWGLVMTFINFLVAFVVIYAGTRLRALQSPGAVYAGTVLAMIPCCFGYCCCVGLPVGVWVIMTMQDEEVKSAFSA